MSWRTPEPGRRPLTPPSAGSSGPFRVLIALAVVLSACGAGSAGDEVDQTTNTSAVDSVQAGSTATSETTEDTGTVDEDSSDQPTAPSRSSGTITVAGVTYLFAVVDDGGTCDPNFFGGFRAILTHVDEDGGPIEMPDQPGFTEGIDVSLRGQDSTEGVILGSFGGVDWYAGDDGYEESRLVSVVIDGTRAEGTATFVTGDGEVVDGSFEVTCVAGSLGASGSSGDFCDDLAGSIAMDEDLDLADPAIDQLLDQAVAQFDELRSRAPSAISGDMDILYQALVAINELFADYAYDFTAIPDDEMQQVSSPQVDEASRNLQEYCDF
jgi:hypothetical protein